MPKELFRQGTFDNGKEYSVFGRAVNGNAIILDDDISIVGQDTILVLPGQNLAGVFDGAGGTTDIGSPLEAAVTAADAVAQFYRRRRGKLEDAMEYARQAVVHNSDAGLCVGSLIRFLGDGTAYVVNAGDTGVAAYSPSAKILEFPGEQQIAHGEPSNFLGRYQSRAHSREPDTVRHFTPQYSDIEYYVMSDGMLGSWMQNTSLEEHHFEAAHDDYLLLQAAIEKRPELQDILRSYLKDPSLSVSKLDWNEWPTVREHIEQYVRPTILRDPRWFSRGLLTRPIAWDFERTHEDDASLVLINYLPFRSR